MSLTARVLAGLAAGLFVGAASAATRHPLLLGVAQLAEPVGTLWLNALRMTVVPLIFALLVTAVAGASEASQAGRLGAHTVALVLLVLSAAGLFGALATPALLAVRPVDPATASILRAGGAAAAEPAAAVPPLAEWVTTLIPANAVEAAAGGAILPLVVFAVVFGLAAARLAAEPRERLLGFFRALGEAMMVIVQWVLRLAPLGVFALVVPFAAGGGLRTVGALAYYVAILAGLCVVATLALYPVGAIGGALSLRRFAGGIAPAQLVAFSTRSSLASLPAMLEAARSRLGAPAAVSGLVLPLAVTLMRATSPLVNLARAVFAAALYGIDLSAPQLAAGAAVAVAMSLASVGLPGEVSFMAANIPIFQVMGLPLEPLALFLAVEVIPDVFRTVGNVTAVLAVTAVVARGSVGAEEVAGRVPVVSTSSS